MSGFAYYRLPYGKQYTLFEQLEGEPEEFSNLSSLNGKAGFVISPFCPSQDEPVLLLRPDRLVTKAVPDIPYFPVKAHRKGLAEEKVLYSKAFSSFKSRLSKGDFEKIVLARKSLLFNKGPVSLESLFIEACRLYPSMFVTLFSTRRSGVWLLATPEILLEGQGKDWMTIALAGTMKKEREASKYMLEGWSEKNIGEQKYVASYIKERLGGFTKKVEMKGPYEVQAGELLHLRTDFSFRLENNGILGDLLEDLHPTPAVCGIPKAETMDFIIKNEASSRKYFSGFSGIIDPSGRTSIFVNLRCMKILEPYCELYAGGGLVRQSEERQEWDETEAKINAMLRLFLIET